MIRRKKNAKLILGALIAMLVLGVGYAAVSGIGLLISGSSSIKANGDFRVRFVRPDSNETAIENASSNAIRISGKNTDESDMDVSEMSASIIDDTHAEFIAGTLDEIGEYVEFTYTVVNESDGIDADLNFVVNNTNNDYFEITKTVSDNRISENETATVTIKVELIGQPKIRDIEESFSVTLTATPVEESEESGSGTGGNEPVATTGATMVTAQSGETHKGIVYLDPSDLTVECDQNSTLTSTNTGCKKFYIFDDSGDTYKMILDHNTSGDVAWNSSNSNVSMNEVATRLSEDTAGWVGNPRLITESEVRTITNNSGTATYYFGSGDSTSYKSQTTEQKAIQQSYHWLFDNLWASTDYGAMIADSNSYLYGTGSSYAPLWGYWTSSGVSNLPTRVWVVERFGSLSYANANVADYYGVRPVITIDKSIFE